MNWLRRLATNRLLDVAAVLVTVWVVVLWAMVLPPHWSDFDFNHYYVGSRMLLGGQNPYTTSLKPMSQAMGFRYSDELPIAGYPPSFLWLFTALTTLPPRSAFAIWVAAEIGCLVVILWVTRQLLGERLSARGWLFVATLAIISRTVSFNLYFSQVQLLLGALVMTAYAAHRAGRHGWACLAVSMAGILKFFPFILLPWFIWSSSDNLRTRLYRVLGVIGFVLAIIVSTGPALWRDFFRYSMPIAVGEEIGRNFNFSLPGLVTNLGYAYHGFHPSADEKQWWWTMRTLAGLVVIASAYAVCLAARRDPEAQFCLLCVAMLAGTITTQGHYFIFLIFPLAVAATRVAARPTTAYVIGLILAVLAVNWMDLPDVLLGHSISYIFRNDIPLYGLFGLGFFFGRELWARRAMGDEAALTVKAAER
jgi:multidrug transporter EmrE-like cation transporter